MKSTDDIRLRYAALVLALVYWGAVAYIELVGLPKDWVLIYFVPQFEASVWVSAAVLTIYLAKIRFVPSVVTRGLAAAAMVLCFVHFTNWAVYEPKSYYLSHRGSFAQVAELVRNGEIGKPGGEYYGEPLLLRVADLAYDRKIRNIGEQDGKPVVLLTTEVGLLGNNGSGYVYFDGTPRPDLEVDLFGPTRLSEAREIGDGWWYW